MNLQPEEQYQIKDGREVRKHLQDVFEPLSYAAASAIEQSLVDAPDIVRGVIDQHTIEPMRPSIAYVSLPPDIFLDRDAPNEADVKDLIAQIEERQPNNLADQYIVRTLQEGEHAIGARYGIKEGMWPTEHISVYWRIKDGLKAYHADGIEPDEWKRREQSYMGASDSDKKNWDAWQAVRGNAYGSAARYYKSFATERSPYLLVTRTQLDHDNAIFGNIAVPVGEYGDDFAAKLLAATAYAIELADGDSAVNGGLNSLSDQVTSTLSAHTARGKESGGDTASAARATLQEGILSIQQTITLLTAEKVDGYEDPVSLLRDLVEQGWVERVAQLVPMGFIGPLALTGRYVPGVITRDSQGALMLGDEFRALLRRSHGEYMEMVRQRQTKSGDALMGLGLTCPVAGKDGGIRKLSEAMLLAVESLS